MCLCGSFCACFSSKSSEKSVVLSNSLWYRGDMRRFFALFLMLFLIQPVQSVTLWAGGVSAESGWYDFNKSFRRGADGDDLLCWAVVASNLLAWWQQQNPGLAGQEVPVGEAVWSTFQSAFENEGSDPDQGIRWWLNGAYVQQNPGGGLRCAALRNTAMGGYYRDGGPAPEQLLYNGRGAGVTAQSLTGVLLRGLHRGDAFWLGASCRRPDGSRFMHSVTVWGADVETNDAGQEQIAAIYMCDSDDRRTALHRIPICESEGMLVFNCPEHPLYGRLGRITLDTYTGFRLRMVEP